MKLVSWRDLELDGAVDRIPYRNNLPLYVEVDGTHGAQDLNCDDTVYRVYNGSWCFRIAQRCHELIAFHVIFGGDPESDVNDPENFLGAAVPVSERAFFNSRSGEYLSKHDKRAYRKAGSDA